MTGVNNQNITEIEDLKSQGKYREARELVQKLLFHSSDDYRLYEELADIALSEGNISDAESMMAFAQKLNPESSTGLYLRGYIAVSKGQFQDGVGLLEEANKLFQNNAEILRNLGWGYLMLGNTGKGILILRRALNLAPDDALIMEDLGVALLSNGDVATGEDLLRRAGREDRIRELKSIMRI
ncbi:MAG TPA: tetratricopeptide repeat protein [bacterium]|nr:tetratricopeptide repeat protein [bacterium]